MRRWNSTGARLLCISKVFHTVFPPVIPTMNDDVTQLLNQIGSGSDMAAEQLLPLVYQKLRQVAAEKMRAQPAGHTLQATALVHEAWLRIGGEAHGWQSRWHFFSAAA